MTFERITVDPKVCGGKPTIHGGLRGQLLTLDAWTVSAGLSSVKS